MLEMSEHYQSRLFPGRTVIKYASPLLCTPQAHTARTRQAHRETCRQPPEQMPLFVLGKCTQLYRSVDFLFPPPSLHTGPFSPLAGPWCFFPLAVKSLAELLGPLSEERFAEPLLCLGTDPGGFLN